MYHLKYVVFFELVKSNHALLKQFWLTLTNHESDNWDLKHTMKNNTPLMLLCSLTLYSGSYPTVSQSPPSKDGGGFGKVCRVP